VESDIIFSFEIAWRKIWHFLWKSIVILYYKSFNCIYIH
jgi:hypothetical protein